MRLFTAVAALALSVTLVAEHVRSEVQNVPVDRLIASLTQQL